jgi:hypothetical protein
MTEGVRAALAAVAVVAAAAAAVALDAVRGPVAAPAALRPTAMGGTVERAAFCPPAGAAAPGVLSLAAPGGRTLVVEPPGRARAVPASGVLTTRASGQPTIATGRGAGVAGSATVALPGRARGAASEACTEEASTQWFFPEGSSSLAADMRLLVFNPFLDEAVVRITFFTARGPKAKATLADVAVPAGRAVAITVNEHIFRQSLLATSVTAERGRVVAWRQLLVGRKRVRALHAGLGARAAAPTWYLPEGGVGPGYDETITLLNPSEDEAVVTITLSTAGRVLQPARLVELTVPPATARRVDLLPPGSGPKEPLAASVTVTSTNGTPVVAERVVAYSRGVSEGVASEVGAPAPARRWFLGAAVAAPDEDEIAVMNPGALPAEVSIRLAAGDATRSPKALRRVRVAAGLRATIALGRWTKGRAWGALLVSDEPVVVERRAASAREQDTAVVMGVPLDHLAGAP